MTTIQDTSRLSHRRKEQRMRKISEDLVGQDSVLLLQALQLFLYLSVNLSCPARSMAAPLTSSTGTIWTSRLNDSR